MTANYQNALQMCQLMLQGAEATVTREMIAQKVEEILSMPTFKEGVDKEALISDLEERFTVWTDEAKVLSNDDDHVPWLSGRRGEIDPRFWNRYKLYLNHQLPPAAVDSVDKVTEEVLSRLEDPTREGPFDRRGLVMGHVQSGKTGNYTGLICKAADAGYKVIIVLAGMHNNLRSQTQIRLDEGFLGYRAAPPTKDGGHVERTGVGKLDPGPKADSVTNRMDNGDFRGAFAKQFAITPGGLPLLFVVKKNVSVLRNLLKWIRGFADVTDPETGRKFHKDVPLLVIDDEADQASVDTRAVPQDESGNPDPEHDPTTTNSLIRQLLYSFGKSAYVGYTATPFANIFIHEHNSTKDEGSDLFPRSFIINIPPPSNYTGASRIFGLKEDAEAGLEEMEALPICRLIDDYAVKRDEDGKICEDGTIGRAETEGWMPPRPPAKTGHVPMYEGEEEVPPSLRKAIMSFILATAVREIREGRSCHNSMLVHVVRYTAVQERVAGQIEDALGIIRSRLQNGDGDRKPTMMDEFRRLWDEDFIATSESDAFDPEALGEDLALPDWADVSDRLWMVSASIEVRTINGSAGDVLDYDDNMERGLNVIAVGGDKLSRGLTLEGLTVSYFLRASRMYDTLMQMGRWFGYRNHYVDVCRLYTTDDLVDWFTHIAAATEELRTEFEHMVNVGGTPRDYGLKVRSHPVLLVTSAVKMRNGTQMKLSYSGDSSETIIFDTSPKVVKANLSVVSSLLAGLGKGVDGEYYWEGVGSEKILDLLAGYVSHEDARRADTELLSRYIRAQNQQDELLEWSVLLASSGTGDARSFEIEGLGKVGLIRRARFPALRDDGAKDAGEKFTIRRLVSPSDESRDLSRTGENSEWEMALALTKLSWEGDTRKNKSETPPVRPGGREIRRIRPKERGLLILYPLDGKNAGLAFEEPLMGMAISFPASDTAREISYTVNNVFTNAGDFDSI